MPSPEELQKACETAILTRKTDAAHSEIAFFGGSFTAIPRDIMVCLLKAVREFVRGGHFKGIRVSTRPDAVDREILELIRDYGVTAVELGAQSMNDAVLSANLRGHSADDVARASELIRGAGLELGLQMMTGLYKSSDESDFETARRIAGLKPDTVRIYPTLVMENSLLASLYRAGEYIPKSLEQAVEQSARLLRFFELKKGIPVIRLGLHSTGDMQKGLLAGPFHPAFRELCESLLYYETALGLLRREMPGGGRAEIAVNPQAVSKMVGQNRSNIKKLRQAGYEVFVKSDPSVKKFDVLYIM